MNAKMLENERKMVRNEYFPLLKLNPKPIGQQWLYNYKKNNIIKRSF